MRRMGVALLSVALAVGPARAQDADGFSFAAGGDMIGPYHAWPAPGDAGFAKVAGLFQGADLGFANQEGSIFDLEGFAGSPAAEDGGGYPLQRQAAARAMRAMGLSLVSKANNHATDWGSDGLAATLRNLAAAGLVQAGSGLGLDQARAPAYLPTAYGLVALVDCASTFPPMAVAGAAITRHGLTSRPRPGLSPLHVREVRLLPPDQIQALRAMAGPAGISTGAELRISDQAFRAAAEPGLAWEMDRADEAAILSAVRAARARARFVLFSIHAHETAGNDDASPPSAFEPMALHRADEAPSPDDPEPASFEPALFHAAIDAGADAVVRTGPHVLGGIELYRGRPIFYSLGSLFFDFGGRRSYTTPNGEVMRFPRELFETAVPVSRFSGRTLLEIRLHPLLIDAEAGPSGGMPHPAAPADALRILARLQALSARFGTRITIEDGVGVIRPEAP